MNATIRFTGITALLIAATAMAVSPVNAAPALQDHGSTVLCKYRTSSPPGQAWTALIKRIIVSPPQLFANGGKQTVGWRFAVRRTVYDGTWSHAVSYRSPIQKAKATATSAADFNTMKVPVTLPANHHDVEIYYEVVIKTFRYRPDGSIKSSSSSLVDDYTVRVKGDGWGYAEHQYSNRCYSLQAAVF